MAVAFADVLLSSNDEPAPFGSSEIETLDVAESANPEPQFFGGYGGGGRGGGRGYGKKIEM